MTRNSTREPQAVSWHKRPRDWSRRISTAAVLSAGILALAGGPITILSAEEANMPTTDGGKNSATADTDATIVKSPTGGCKVTASASASSSSTSNGETVTRESHKSVSGPCGSATATSKATATSGSGETDENAN
jgi:hypothetical protein